MADVPSYIPPGALGSDGTPNVTMMICTAGHVDHGKTRLVKLLTGCETDRLKTERERGLTIELGFAPCVIGGDTCVGIVDVPGHEKFIRNMVAGVSGIGMCVLVIAADDSIMPQTVEHMRIMEFMGVPQGMVALTKTDLADENRIQQTIGEIRTFLDGTFLENAPICPVSSETFEGYFEFYDTLTEQISKIKRKESHGLFRMPVEQIFSKSGFGSVIMGIPLDGSIVTGDRVELFPGGAEGKVRGIQQFLHDTDRGEYGQCLALNISEYGKTPPERGQVIAAPGSLTSSMTVHVRLETVPELDIPLKNAELIKFHTGTAEENGKIYLLEHKDLGGGKAAFASIVLNNPVVAAAHDRFIVRRPSPASTIAGGDILALSGESGKPRKRIVLDALNRYLTFLGDADPLSTEGISKRLEFNLLDSGKDLTAAELARNVLVPMPLADSILGSLAGQDRALSLGSGWYAHADTVGAISDELQSRIESASTDGQTLTLSPGELRKGIDCSQRLWNAVEDRLEKKGLISRRNNAILLDGAASSMNEEDRALAHKIEALYSASGFSSPRPDELAGMLHEEDRLITKLMDYLCGQKILIRLSKNVVLSREVFMNAQNTVIEIICERGELDSWDFKQRIGSTRKYAIAILDYLDSQHVTIRSGNLRSLAADYKRRLLT